ncbi:hypothetical protein G7048_19095 [Diaphorobacter sp. HDW4B]|uniref:hypothetical protein n=1 Tax=Diaphorobacter sp. HDW4B TaxID=2714925 RepID=UPI00140B40F5|nr:hypothetical protein [Diaphorobacter sp. HDW4B]QIL68911.1 hypothetical protein G7048_19095 [Diaphorobacter sp. HDW4B]
MTAQTQPEAPGYAADGKTPLYSIIGVGILVSAVEFNRLYAEIEQLREHMQFVERWAVHHGTKPCVSAKEALGVIQHYPPIRSITDGYANGKRPDTFDPYARIAELEAERDEERESANEWRRLALQFDGHRMQALGHLRVMLKNPFDHCMAVTEFLEAPPLSGEEVLAQRLAQLRESKPQCEWTYNDDYFHWQTSCGHAHLFGDGGIHDNKYSHCPYCGGGIGEKKP